MAYQLTVPAQRIRGMSPPSLYRLPPPPFTLSAAPEEGPAIAAFADCSVCEPALGLGARVWVWVSGRTLSLAPHPLVQTVLLAIGLGAMAGQPSSEGGAGGAAPSDLFSALIPALPREWTGATEEEGDRDGASASPLCNMSPSAPALRSCHATPPTTHSSSVAFQRSGAGGS